MTDQYGAAIAGASSWTCHVKWIQHWSRCCRETTARKAHILACRFTFDSTTWNVISVSW